MKATGFYAITEKGGWLHGLVLEDGEKKALIEDDTDNVRITANFDLPINQAATLWARHKMGTSGFEHEAGYVLGLPEINPNSTNVHEGLSAEVWDDTGVKLSYLAD